MFTSEPLKWLQNISVLDTPTHPISTIDVSTLDVFVVIEFSKYLYNYQHSFLLFVDVNVFGGNVLMEYLQYVNFCCRYGRKMSLVVYLVIKLGGSVVAVFAPDYITFVIGRFIADIGACGVGLTAFVIGKIPLAIDSATKNKHSSRFYSTKSWDKDTHGVRACWYNLENKALTSESGWFYWWAVLYPQHCCWNTVIQLLV